jgi:hypothetical protein
MLLVHLHTALMVITAVDRGLLRPAAAPLQAELHAPELWCTDGHYRIHHDAYT